MFQPPSDLSALASCTFLPDDFFQVRMEGHHHQVMFTSNVCYWKASSLSNVNTGAEVLLCQYIVNLVVMLAVWAMPCPTSRCFLGIICVCQHEVFVAIEFQEPEAPII